MKTKADLILGIGWAVIAVLIWSASLVLLRLGIETGLNAYDLTALRFGVAAVLLMPVLLGQRHQLRKIPVFALLSIIFLFGAPYILLISFAMKTAPATAAGVLNPACMAVCAVFLGWLFMGIKVSPLRIVGVSLSCVGMAVFVWNNAPLMIGYMILVGTGLMWALYSLIVRRFMIPAKLATAIVAVGSAFIYVPVYIWALPKQLGAVALSDVAIQAGFQGVLVSVVALYAFNRSVELVGLVAGATFPATIPFVTMLLSLAILGERPDLNNFVAVIVLTVGLLLILSGASTGSWSKLRFLVHGANRRMQGSGE